MNENKEAIDALLNGVDYLIQNSLKSAPNDRVFVGIIKRANSNNTYDVSINNNIYSNVQSLFKGLAVGSTVKVLSPQNQMNNMFILGNLNMTLGGGGGGAVTSVNNKTGAVVLNYQDVGALPNTTFIPTDLSDLNSDATHRTVTDAQIQQFLNWQTQSASDININYDTDTSLLTVGLYNINNQKISEDTTTIEIPQEEEITAEMVLEWYGDTSGLIGDTDMVGVVKTITYKDIVVVDNGTPIEEL